MADFVIDLHLKILLGGVIAILTVASMIGYLLGRNEQSESASKVIDNLNARIRAWWLMCAIFAGALLTGGLGATLLFALISFLALREFITLTPTQRADHHTLFWCFFVWLPLQYYLIASPWYGLFAILIPVYCFLFIPTRCVLAGDTDNFLERTSKIQWGMMICVYCVSHAPAILMLEIPGYEGENAKLLLYLVIVAQLSDVLQYVFGKTMGSRKIAPRISPNKTWEGFLGGIAMASLIGGCLWWATPFEFWQSVFISLIITLMGFAGGLCMSAIKRDSGVKDFGSFIEGHGGMLDRIDSICFSAPIFFHIIRYYFTV